MNRKATFMLIVAVLSGLGAMYGTSQLLANNRGRKPVELQDMVVAARNLKVDEIVKPDMIKTVRVPKDNAPAGSFQQTKDVVERYVQIPILADEPMVDAKLAPKGSPAGLVSRIPKGMRAFAVDITETTGVSGFVLPGHRVDVIQSHSSPGPAQGQAEMVLQNALVLAAGQTFTRPEDKSILARTVTLAVTPDQVETLVAARTVGPLTLSLRGVNDNDVVARKPAPPPPPPPAPAPPPEPDPALLAKKPAPPVHLGATADEAGPPPKKRRLTVVHGLQAIEVITLPDLKSPGQDDAESGTAPDEPAERGRPSRTPRLSPPPQG